MTVVGGFEPVPPTKVDGKPVVFSDYDMSIVTLGYERRSRFVAEAVVANSGVTMAFGFEDRHVASYAENLTWYLDHAITPMVLDDDDYETDLRESLKTLSAKDTPHICIDVSSLTRTRIASTIAAVLDCDFSMSVDVAYAPAAFRPPIHDLAPIQFSGFVHPRFSGFSPDPALPSVAVLGVGYEVERAVGAIEYLEPAGWWIFIPGGVDPRYDKAIKSSNALLEDVLVDYQMIPYRVLEPFGCLSSLESLVAGLIPDTRVVLVPFGPKIFAATTVLVSALYPEVGVWRVSAGPLEGAIDQQPDGTIARLRVQFVADEAKRS